MYLGALNATPRGLPSGYTQLEYIESAGTQYIDTGFKPNQNTRVVVDFQFSNVTDTQFLFGCRTSDFKNRFTFLLSPPSFRSDFGTSEQSISSLSLGSRYVVDHNKNVCTVGSVTVTNTASSFSSSFNLFLFGSNISGSTEYLAGVRLYSCQIYDNGTLIRDYVPCKNSSGTVGLYDLVNDVFYENAGTGTFIAGATVGFVARSIANWYFGDSNKVARNIVKGYIGDASNLARLFRVTNGLPLADLPVGSLIQLNESGSGVNFYLAKHDYESGLNGAGRELVARKDCYDARQWHSSDVNAYASSTIDTWLNGTYKELLDSTVRSLIGNTKFYYTPGNGTTTQSTLSRSVFLLSLYELGKTVQASYTNPDGSILPIASTLQTVYFNGTKVAQWTRSPYMPYTERVYSISTNNTSATTLANNTTTYSRPCFTLPATALVNPEPNADGSYTLIV